MDFTSGLLVATLINAIKYYRINTQILLYGLQIVITYEWIIKNFQGCECYDAFHLWRLCTQSIKLLIFLIYIVFECYDCNNSFLLSEDNRERLHYFNVNASVLFLIGVATSRILREGQIALVNGDLTKYVKIILILVPHKNVRCYTLAG